MRPTRSVLCALAAMSISAVVSSAGTKPLNVLVLLADDWRYDTLACAGDAIGKTPAVDRLASAGVRFTQACVTTAICGVSRASLFTGQWMSRHGDPASAMFQTPWAQTYPGWLRENGYWVAHVGKWHNGRSTTMISLPRGGMTSSCGHPSLAIERSIDCSSSTRQPKLGFAAIGLSCNMQLNST